MCVLVAISRGVFFESEWSKRECVGALRKKHTSERPEGWEEVLFVFEKKKPHRATAEEGLVSRLCVWTGKGYLVDPASGICLSQGLSHASASISEFYDETANGSVKQL